MLIQPLLNRSNIVDQLCGHDLVVFLDDLVGLFEGFVLLVVFLELGCVD